MRWWMLALIVSATIGIQGPTRAAEPTSRPTSDLEKENRELRERLKAMQKELDQLRSRPQNATPRQRDPFDVPQPVPPRYYRFDIPFVPPPGSPSTQPSPHFHFEIPVPPGIPSIPRLVPPPSTRPNVAPNPRTPPDYWQKRQFNGSDVYVIPLG